MIGFSTRLPSATNRECSAGISTQSPSVYTSFIRSYSFISISIHVSLFCFRARASSSRSDGWLCTYSTTSLVKAIKICPTHTPCFSPWLRNFWYDRRQETMGDSRVYCSNQCQHLRCMNKKMLSCWPSIPLRQALVNSVKSTVCMHSIQLLFTLPLLLNLNHTAPLI